MEQIPFEIDLHHIALLGLVLVVLMMLRLWVQRTRRNAKREQERRIAIQAAHETARKQQLSAVVPKSKVSAAQTRIPLADPFSTPFTGNIQGVAAKWEAEVHQIGRQIIGQIDCKMAALQAITLDANRTANRLEILLEHLEQVARKQIERQQQIAQNANADTSPTVLSAVESAHEAAPLADVLKELTEDLEDVRRTIKQRTTFGEQSKSILVLRPTEPQKEETPTTNLRDEVEMLSNYGLDPPEIAQRLNISLGEVDLMLQVQRNRLNRTV